MTHFGEKQTLQPDAGITGSDPKAVIEPNIAVRQDRYDAETTSLQLTPLCQHQALC